MSRQQPKIEEIFAGTLDIDSPRERRAYLEHACGGDAALRKKIERLVEAHEAAGDFLETPMAQIAPERTDSLLEQQARRDHPRSRGDGTQKISAVPCTNSLRMDARSNLSPGRTPQR